eukprot:2476875-Pyramimonas_sp.AAC.1
MLLAPPQQYLPQLAFRLKRGHQQARPPPPPTRAPTPLPKAKMPTPIVPPTQPRQPTTVRNLLV